jgi:hypothetical protein
MTSPRVQITLNIVLFSLIIVVVAITPLLSYAETNNTPVENGGVVLDEISSSTEAVSSNAPVPTSPWFRVEKLTGDSIQQGDFVVGPGRAEIEVKPGQTIVYEISVANRIDDNRVFNLEVEDVAGSADGSRSVQLLGEERGPYTVKDYITFPEKSFTLDLGDRARIPVTISLPPDAEPGGYYGSVLVSTVKGAERSEVGESTTESPIVARISTLFFITVPGDIKKSGEMKELSLINKPWWYEKGPIDFNILYENTGSIHLNPYGEIRIKNIFDEEVGFMELEPWFVLPKSLRSKEVKWDREMLLGRYVATAYINRGYDDVVDEKSVVFWVLPWKLMVGTFVGIFIILFLIRLFFRTFEFKKKT